MTKTHDPKNCNRHDGSISVAYTHLGAVLRNHFRLASNSIRIFCPFIRSKALRSIVEAVPKHISISIVMRWERRAFESGACDPEVFGYCKEEGIGLYQLPKLHMKSFIVDDNKLVAGSANITEAALGILRPANWELLVTGLQLSDHDLDQYAELDDLSFLVTEDDYKKSMRWFESAPLPAETLDEETKPLLSMIPSSRTPGAVWEIYRTGEGNTPTGNSDLDAMQLPPNLDRQGFDEVFRDSLLTTPLMVSLTDELRQGDLYFGRLKQWLMRNCHDADGMSARDMEDPANRLLEWIDALNMPGYGVDRPNISERLRYETEVGPESVLRAIGAKVRPGPDIKLNVTRKEID